jgi:hypothetical protein
VAPARRSDAAEKEASSKKLEDGAPTFRTLLEELPKTDPTFPMNGFAISTGPGTLSCQVNGMTLDYFGHRNRIFKTEGG